MDDIPRGDCFRKSLTAPWHGRRRLFHVCIISHAIYGAVISKIRFRIKSLASLFISKVWPHRTYSRAAAPSSYSHNVTCVHRHKNSSSCSRTSSSEKHQGMDVSGFEERHLGAIRNKPFPFDCLNSYILEVLFQFDSWALTRILFSLSWEGIGLSHLRYDFWCVSQHQRLPRHCQLCW